MHDLVVSHQAEADLIEIWEYSDEMWGEERADLYLDALGYALARCAENPGLGRRRDELRAGYQSIVILRHVAFYTVGADQLVVQRILHGSMEEESNL